MSAPDTTTAQPQQPRLPASAAGRPGPASAAPLQAPPLQRHDLVWLHRAAWQQVLDAQRGDGSADDWPDGLTDAAASACLQHWAQHDLPLVVTRQPQAAAFSGWMLGLPAPLQWQRRRLFVGVQPGAVQRSGQFPLAHIAAPLLPAAARAGWLGLCAALAAGGAQTRVFGSYGWQATSGLAHIHEASDLDLLLHVRSAAQADAAVAVLAGSGWARPRLDGELLFPDGAAVAWREWQQWRSRGSAGPLLVKRLHGAALETPGMDGPGLEARTASLAPPAGPAA